MAILKKNAFSRRVPDLVTEELVAVLSRRASFEFKQLFDVVHENLRARNAASGGEEMLRLRAYEKLQNLVARGAVKKLARNIRGFRPRSPWRSLRRTAISLLRLPQPPPRELPPSPEPRPRPPNNAATPAGFAAFSRCFAITSHCYSTSGWQSALLFPRF